MMMSKEEFKEFMRDITNIIYACEKVLKTLSVRIKDDVF